MDTAAVLGSYPQKLSNVTQKRSARLQNSAQP
nr:MAG TPA: hypothetical protein [Caudoviricetes sp.]